jgi:hypothetical protein
VRILRLLTLGIITALAGAASAQTTLTQVWKIQADDPAYTFFTSTDALGSSLRGAAVNKQTTGSVLAAAVQGGVAIYRIDKATKALRTPSTVPGPFTVASTGARLMNKVVVTDDGVVYSCPLSTTGAFKIWRNADELTAATDAYAEAAPVASRMGDDMSVTGTGNGTKILIAQSGLATLARFTTTDGGLTFAKSIITPTGPAVSATPSVAWDPNGTDYWFRNTGTTGAQKYNGTTNAGLGGLSGDTAGAYGPIDVAAYDAKTLVGVGIGASAASQIGKPIQFFDVASAATPLYQGFDSEFSPGGAKVNANGQGDVMFDAPASRVYVLYTNNSLSAYSLPTATVGDWNLY